MTDSRRGRQRPWGTRRRVTQSLLCFGLTLISLCLSVRPLNHCTCRWHRGLLQITEKKPHCLSDLKLWLEEQCDRPITAVTKYLLPRPQNKCYNTASLAAFQMIMFRFFWSHCLPYHLSIPLLLWWGTTVLKSEVAESRDIILYPSKRSVPGIFSKFTSTEHGSCSDYPTFPIGSWRIIITF